ncbi:MAG TPA: glycosyltransferase [Bacteroidales bacterium]|nr:glycosyltransferase [Bacteroidales bacterium]HPM91358.1 glycosyltransferase [Bacteroidales bacterium]
MTHRKMAFLRKTYRPWTILWVIQRFIVVMKERRLPQVRMVDLMYDFRLTRKIRGDVRNRTWNTGLADPDVAGGLFNFVPTLEYKPFIINDDVDENELSVINHIFDRIYVINLGRRLDRRVEMIMKLRKYCIKAEIFEAGNGYSKENSEAFAAYYDLPLAAEGCHPLEKELKKKMIASPGSWGYLLTWKYLLNDAKSKGFARILVFDDDVLFHKDFEKKTGESLKSIPGNWKLLYLGATQHDWSVPYNVNYPDKVGEKDFGVHPFYYPVKTDGSFAVGVDCSVFDEILSEIEPMNCALDSGPLRAIQQRYPGQCFVVKPNLVVADVGQSDIGVERDQGQMARKLRWQMDLYDYPFRKELVSVIMPAYNAEKTIEKSIRSILMQTYRELEMIVADDGSTDSTVAIVDRLAKNDSRVKLVRLDSNQGCYPARNAALRVAKGRYIAIQDSDDISLATRIETQLIPLLTGRALFTLTRILRGRCSIDELDIGNQREMAQLVLDRRMESASGLYEYRDRPVIGFMTSMFRRELFEELGLFWEHRFGADAEFLERVLFQKAGILLSKKDGTIHSFLMDRDAIPGIYERIDKVLLISADMTGDNITNRHSQKEKDAFEGLWRQRLRGEYQYNYPKFNP